MVAWAYRHICICVRTTLHPSHLMIIACSCMSYSNLCSNIFSFTNNDASINKRQTWEQHSVKADQANTTVCQHASLSAGQTQQNRAIKCVNHRFPGMFVWHHAYIYILYTSYIYCLSFNISILYVHICNACLTTCHIAYYVSCIYIYIYVYIYIYIYTYTYVTCIYISIHIYM